MAEITKTIKIKFVGDDIDAQTTVKRLEKSISGLGDKLGEFTAELSSLKASNSLTADLNKFAATSDRLAKQTANNKIREEARAAAEIARINQRGLKQSLANDSILERADTQLANHRIKEAERAQRAASDKFLNLLKNNQNPPKPPGFNGSDFQKDLFSTIFGATTLSGLAVNAITGAFNELRHLVTEMITGVINLGVKSVNLAGDFQVTTSALKVFTGSTRLAKQELSEIEDLAGDTAGLRLVSAQEGYQQLRALGFEAKLAKGFIKELGEEKILSGADDEALKRITFNFAQIASGGQKVSQELRELYTSMPTLKRAFLDAFGTTDPQKIQAFFDKDVDKAFQMLVDAMARGEAAAGGFNDTWGKTADEFIKAGRLFGEPVLDPLTDSLKGVTGFLRENKDTWSSWGIHVADIIRGMNSEVATLKNGGEGGNGYGAAIWQATKIGVNFLTKSSGYSLSDIGADERRAKQPETERAALLQKNADAYNEAVKKSEAFAAKLHRQAEAAVARDLALLKTSAAEAETILKNRFEVEQALRDSAIRYTSEQEKAFAESSGAAKSAYLQSEIARQAGVFNKQIELQSGNDEEIKKLALEKNKALSELNKDYRLNEINTQKQVREFERKILDERRQAAIEFKQLQIRESQFKIDAKTFDVDRTQTGYDELIKLTQSSYAEVLRLTKESYAEQLKNRSLTNEQHYNLTKQGYLDEQKLAEDNRRAILGIEEKQYRKSLENIETAFNRRKGLIESAVQDTQRGIGLLSPDAFASNSSSLIQRSLTGSDLPTLRKQTVGDAETLIPTIKDFRADAQNRLSDAINAKDADAVKAIGVEVEKWTEQLIENESALENWGSLIVENVFKVNSLVEKIKSGGGVIADFDALGLESLKFRQDRENQVLDAEIKSYAERIELAKKHGKTVESETLTYAKAVAERNKNSAAMQNEAEIAAYLTQTTKGLNEQLDKLRSGDKVSIDLIKDAADKDLVREKIALTSEIYRLEEGYYKDSELWALRRKETLLNANREIYEAEQNSILSQIESQVKLSHQVDFSSNQVRAKVLEHLASQKNLNESIADGIIGVYDAAANSIDKTIDKTFEKFGAFKSLFAEPLKFFAKDALSNFTSGILDAVLPSEIKTLTEKSNNPIVNQQIKTNDLLKEIKNSLTSPIGGAGGVGSGGLTVGSLVGAATGGGGLNSSGVIKNLVGGGGANGTRTGDVLDGVTQIFAGDKGRQDIISNIKHLFSTKAGGIFGEKGFGNNVGTYGAIGGLGNLIGGLVGGRVGGFISGAGSGLATGAQIGSMFAPGIGTAIGAAVGAIGGGLMSLFSDPKRKADKQQMPQLSQGFADALGQLRQLAANKNAILSDPDGVISKATEIRGQIASSFGLNWQSKKYRAQAQTQISSRLIEADGVIAEIKEFAKKAYSAKNLENRIVGEFAGGVYMDSAFASQYGDFKRRNGMMAGAFTGKDTIPAMIANGEMVLNPRQIAAVVKSAGYDPFAYAGIPNYPNKPQPIKGYAEGGYFGGSAPTLTSSSNSSNGERVMNLTLNLYQDEQKNWQAEAESDSGQKVIAKIVEKKFRNRELNLKTR